MHLYELICRYICCIYVCNLLPVIHEAPGSILLKMKRMIRDEPKIPYSR